MLRRGLDTRHWPEAIRAVVATAWLIQESPAATIQSPPTHSDGPKSGQDCHQKGRGCLPQENGISALCTTPQVLIRQDGIPDNVGAACFSVQPSSRVHGSCALPGLFAQGAQDAKRAKQYGKLGKQIVSA